MDAGSTAHNKNTHKAAQIYTAAGDDNDDVAVADGDDDDVVDTGDEDDADVSAGDDDDTVAALDSADATSTALLMLLQWWGLGIVFKATSAIPLMLF